MATQFTTKHVVQMSLLMLCVSVLGSMSATQTLAHIFRYQPALGDALSLGGARLYWPWAWLEWQRAWGTAYPRPFALASIMGGAGVVFAFVAPALLVRRAHALRPFGENAWASFADIEAAGLFAKGGTILGKIDGEIIAFDGPEHQLLIGASRSGKGRGHVVPTLLAWKASALVLDIKGELDHGDPRHGFPGTSGFRALLGPVLRFAPTSPHSNSFNPLFEVRRGLHEIRDVQNIVEALVHPQGETRGAELFWNNKGKEIITGVIVHVLYSEPVARKTLAVVREKLRDLDRTAEEMRTSLHRFNPNTGQAEVHPEVLHAAESYLASEERLRSGIKATAESFFGMFADPVVADKTARSDFRIGDLMCLDQPVTLYLQPPPSDAPRLMPLMRLFINITARALMEDQTRDGLGREKKHRLLMLLDEFPQLGRLDFFEKMMGAMAGYGVKIYLVCQSLNHIISAYGRDNVILDNAHIVTAFSASDPETAKRIADMAGEVWEVRPHESEQRPRAVLGARKGTITYREERRPLLLPTNVRALARDEELIFVAGAKPIRAKKLRFDQERLFAKRLRPPAPKAAGRTTAHDWEDTRLLGRLPPTAKPRTRAKVEHRALLTPAAQPTPQSDLFKQDEDVASAPASPTISERAQARLRSPQAPAPNTQESEPPKRSRATGV